MDQELSISFDGAPEASADAIRAACEALRARRDGGETGFADAPRDRTSTADVVETASRFRRRFETLLAIGTGGALLGIDALVAPLVPSGGGLEVRGVDTGDPGAIRDAFAAHAPERTAYLFVSQAGTTPNTVSAWTEVRDRLRDRLRGGWRDHVAIVTDPAHGVLREEAARTGVPSFGFPALVGRLTSVFTPVGLLPAAAAGIDVVALLDGARATQAAVDADPDPDRPALGLAAILGPRGARRFRVEGRGGFAPTAAWFRRLLAERLGRAEAEDGLGIVIGGPVEAGPGVSVRVGPPSERNVAALLQSLMIATAVARELDGAAGGERRD